MPSLPVTELPQARLVPTAPAALPSGGLDPVILASGTSTSLPDLTPDLLAPVSGSRATRGEPTTADEGRRIIQLPETTALTDADFHAVDRDGPGTRKVSQATLRRAFGAPRLVTVNLIHGPADDYGIVELGDNAVAHAQVWAPDHLTGQPYGAALEIVFTPVRSIRIGLRKGLIPGGRVDLVLTGG